jgi:hypothetical protein
MQQSKEPENPHSAGTMVLIQEKTWFTSILLAVAWLKCTGIVEFVICADEFNRTLLNVTSN